jgi:hypothetical protein
MARAIRVVIRWVARALTTVRRFRTGLCFSQM